MRDIKKTRKTLVIIIAVLLVSALLTGLIVRRSSIHSIMDDARNAVTIYIPNGYPDYYFHNYAFQDPVSICMYELSYEEENIILNDILSKSSEWKIFSKIEVTKLYEMISFLKKKDIERVDFDERSYYCCFTRSSYQEGTWIELKNANYYMVSYYIFIYNPNKMLYNLIVI